MLSWREEIRAQLRLALPVVVIQLGLYGMGAVDGLFMGRVSAVEYASVSIGHSITFILLAFGMGLLSALDPIISQAWGARDIAAISRGLQRGLFLAVATSIVLGLIILPARSWLILLDQPEEIVPLAASYARISILSFPAFLIFVALRQSMQAMHLMRPLVFVILITNLLNAFFDWVLINGHLGFEPRGAVGCAWGTVLARWCMVLLLPVFAGKDLTRFLWPRAPRVLRPAAVGRMLVLGFPIGLQFLFEIGAFCAVAILIGQLGARQVAGHQVAISLASASFMVPWGIAMAASVRVGNEVGRGNFPAVRRAAAVSMMGGAGIMAVFGALFLTAPYPLARIFTNLEEVLDVAILLIPIAGLFQVFDGTQGVAGGIMRGMADTRIPMLIHVFGFWAIAIPLGHWLAFTGERGAAGLWWALVVGLVVVAVAQFLRLRFLLRRGVRRVVIDEGEAGSP